MGGIGPLGQQVEPRHVVWPDQGLHGRVAAEVGGDPLLVVDPEGLVQARTAQVRIHEEDPLAGLGERDREVEARLRLSFLRQARRHQDRARGLVRGGEQRRGAQLLVGLRELGAGIGVSDQVGVRLRRPTAPSCRMRARTGRAGARG